MKILVVNCGSSSLKFQFIDSEKEEVLAKIELEKGDSEVKIKITAAGVIL